MAKQQPLFASHEEPVEAAKAEAEALKRAVETPRVPHEPDLEGWPAIRRCACGCNVGRLHADGVRCADCDRHDVEGEG
jgi:hypothetical protein